MEKLRVGERIDRLALDLQADVLVHVRADLRRDEALASYAASADELDSRASRVLATFASTVFALLKDPTSALNVTS